MKVLTSLRFEGRDETSSELSLIEEQGLIKLVYEYVWDREGACQPRRVELPMHLPLLSAVEVHMGNVHVRQNFPPS